MAEFRLTANVASTPIRRRETQVSAADLYTPLRLGSEAKNGIAAGMLRVPKGSDRVLGLEAYDASGMLIHVGAARSM